MDTLPTPIPLSERDNCAYIFRRQHIPPAAGENFLYEPQYVGHYIARRSFFVERSSYTSVLALFTVAGEGTLYGEENDLPMTPGSVFVQDCVQPHRYGAASDSWEFHYIHFRGAACTPFAQYMSSRFGAVHRMEVEAFRRSIQLLEQIAGTIEDSGAPIPLSALTYELMMTLAGDAGDLSTEASAVDAVRAAAAYMDTHFAENISTTVLAARAYMTRAYFSTLFKRVCGVTPHEYLTACRIDSAKRLLREGEMSLSAVAEAVGYSDASAFARAFSRHSALTPAQYRRMSLK